MVATLNIFPRGETLEVVRMRSEHAAIVGIDIPVGYIALRVQRPRRSGIYTPLDIPAGCIVCISNDDKTCYVRVIEFVAFKRYENQKRVDTGYCLVQSFASPVIPWQNEESQGMDAKYYAYEV